MHYKKIIVFCITVLLVITGCTSKKQTSKEPSIKKNEQPKAETLYEYGQAIKGYNGQNLKLSDFRKFTDVLNNEKTELSVGVLVIADGYLQKYKVENNATYDFMQPIKVNTSEKKESKIQMEDFILDEKDAHSFHVGGVLNPSPIKKLVDYNVNHSITQLAGIKVITDETDSYTVQKPKEENDVSFTAIEDSDLKQMHITMENLEQAMTIQILQNGKEIHDYLNPSEKIEVKAAGDYGAFNIYLFADGKPYDAQTYYPMETKKGYFSVRTITLPSEIKQYKNFFLVFAPKEQKNYIEQSEKFMIGSEKNE